MPPQKKHNIMIRWKYDKNRKLPHTPPIKKRARCHVLRDVSRVASPTASRAGSRAAWRKTCRFGCSFASRVPNKRETRLRQHGTKNRNKYTNKERVLAGAKNSSNDGTEIKRPKHQQGAKNRSQEKNGGANENDCKYIPATYMSAPWRSRTATALRRSASQATCNAVRAPSIGSGQFTSPLWAMHHAILSTSSRAAA